MKQRSSFSLQQKRHRGLLGFLAPGVLFIALFVAYPILYNFWLSIHDVGLGNLGGEWPFVGLGNYVGLFQSRIFTQTLWNSVAFTVGSIAPQFVIGFALAVLLLKKFPGAQIVRGGIILGWVIAPIVVGTVWRWMFNSDYGLINHFLQLLTITSDRVSWLPNPDRAMIAVIVANVWLGIPFNMMLLIGGLSALPVTVYDSASIDGANRVQTFFFITVPMMRQTMAATIMLGLMFTFKVFDLIWVMTRGGPVNSTTTLPILTYRYSFNFFEFGLGATVAIVLFVFMAIVSIGYIHKFVGVDE